MRAVGQRCLVLTIQRIEVGTLMRAETSYDQRDVVGFENMVQGSVLFLAG